MGSVGVSTVVFDGYPMEVAFDTLAEMGIRSVEPAFIAGYVDFDEATFSRASAKSMNNLLTSRGLIAGAVSAHIDLAAPDAREMLARRVDYAATIGARFLITNSTTRAQDAAFRACITAALEQAKDADVVIALENPGHGQNDLIGNGGDGARLIREIDSPNLLLNYDFGNIHTYSGGELRPEDDFETAAPVTGHAHLKDMRDTGNGWEFTGIGEGDLDYSAIARSVARNAPNVATTLELPLRLRRPGYGDPIRTGDRLSLHQIKHAIKTSLANWETVLARTEETTGTT